MTCDLALPSYQSASRVLPSFTCFGVWYFLLVLRISPSLQLSSAEVRSGGTSPLLHPSGLTYGLLKQTFLHSPQPLCKASIKFPLPPYLSFASSRLPLLPSSQKQPSLLLLPSFFFFFFCFYDRVNPMFVYIL